MSTWTYKASLTACLGLALAGCGTISLPTFLQPPVREVVAQPVEEDVVEVEPVPEPVQIERPISRGARPVIRPAPKPTARHRTIRPPAKPTRSSVRQAVRPASTKHKKPPLTNPLRLQD